MSCLEVTTGSAPKIPYNPVNRRNSLLGACQIISACFLPAFYPR